MLDHPASNMHEGHAAGDAIPVPEILARLRESEAWQAFLLKLSDALRPLTDPAEIQNAAMHALGQHLGVNHAYYAEVLPDGDTLDTERGYFEGAVNLAGRMKMSDFGDVIAAKYRAGETIVINDVRTDNSFGDALQAAFAAVQMRSAIGVPLLKQGRFVAVMSVHQSTPRNWTPSEISLVEEVAKRTWEAIERARTESALRESEGKYRTLFNSIDEGFCVIEMIFDESGAPVDYRYLETNPAYEKQSGLRDVIGRRMLEIVPNIEQEWITTFGRIVLTGEPARVERHTPSLGRWFDVYAFRNGAPETQQVAVLFTDSTARHRAEEKLRETQERQRLIVENAREYAIFSLDLDRRITSWNSGAQSILGYAQEETIGQSGDIIFTPEDRAAGAPEGESATALAEGRASDERWHMRKDGSRFWGSGVMMAMHDAQGKAIGLVKIFRDQTAELRAKEALEQSLQETERARAEAEAANQAKDHFLAVLSHELRTPLTPVLMAARTLAKRKDLPPRAAEALEMIGRNIELESRFIDDLLDLTRIGRGTMEVVREPMDLHDAIQRAIEISKPDIHVKKQRLITKLEAKEHRVSGDTMRLQQVFWNLLKNASKFTPPEGEIRLTSHNERGRIVVEVSDTGIGINAEALSKIFDPFVQADETVTRRFGGLGLGLALSKATMDAHQGALRASSEGSDHGATFIVELALLS